VEKAKAQGSREILADALQKQCRMFSDIQQVQNAVSACREAREISAATGDREREGRTLLTWGVVIAQTDAPEARRLIKAAQSIFRRNGSEVGLALAFDNLAIVTDDSAAAEKLERQSVAIWRRIDDTRNLTLAISNLAGARTNQGDLRGALQLYEESLKVGRDNEAFGYAALTNLNIAGIHHLQGDLAGAKQEFEQVIALWQKHGDVWGTPYARLGLGSLLIEQADFSGARKMYEQALAMRIPRGDKIPIAEAQLALADLSLEEGRSPAEQETAVRQTLEVFQKQKVHDDETQAWCVLARALLAEGKAAAAKEAMQHALAAKSHDPNIRWPAAITAARIETAATNPVRSAAGIAARKELATIITKSRELGYMGIELDARLVLAEIEMKAGQITAGREHLTAIEAEAKAKGYNLIARKATTARG
jgi:tetratricopeptide (TPR) repeat protein